MSTTPEQYTILEAARAAGISKNTAKYRLRKAPEGTTTKGPDGLIYVSAAGAKWLKETASNQDEPPVYEPDEPGSQRESPVHQKKTTGSKTTGSSDRDKELLIELLQSTVAAQAEQLREKGQHIDRLMGQLESTTQALQAAQDQTAQVTAALQSAQEQASAAMALHAGTIQQNLLVAADPQETATAPESEEDPAPITLGDALRQWWRGRKA